LPVSLDQAANNGKHVKRIEGPGEVFLEHVLEASKGHFWFS
jgi:hypothetical protein